MSASSEIRFKIGADTSALSRGLVQAQTIAAAAGKSIRKKLGMQDAFKSTVLALGLSIEKISEKLAEMFTGGAQESWKAALDSAKEAERIIEESALRRMSTLRQIEALEKEIARNAGKENANPQKTGELGTLRKALDAIGEGMFGGAASFLEKIGANKNVVGSLRRSADIYQQRGNMTGDGVETPADAAKRSQEAITERLTREAKIAELKEKSARDQARVDAAFLDVARLTMTEEEKALQIQEEMIKAEEKLTEANRKGMETTELQLDVLRKQKALEEQLLKIEKEQTEEDKKKKRLREDFVDKYKRFLSAQAGAGNAQQGLRDARHDALAPSLDDLASGAGTHTSRVKANRILQLEARARKLFASGSTESAQQLHARALQMRGSLGMLNTADKNPFAAAEAHLKEAKEYLKEIQELLTPTDPE